VYVEFEATNEIWKNCFTGCSRENVQIIKKHCKSVIKKSTKNVQFQNFPSVIGCFEESVYIDDYFLTMNNKRNVWFCNEVLNLASNRQNVREGDHITMLKTYNLMSHITELV